jgi:hypothetical protein
VNQPQLDAGPLEFVQQHDRDAHVAGQAVEGDGIEAVDAAEVDDLAEFPHGGAFQRCAGTALVVEPLAGPMKPRFARRSRELPAGHELGVAGTKCVVLGDRLTGVDGVADHSVTPNRHDLELPAPAVVSAGDAHGAPSHYMGQAEEIPLDGVAVVRYMLGMAVPA